MPSPRHDRSRRSTVAPAGAVTLASLLITFAAATPASAVNYVTSANGASWGIHDAAAPGLDTGSIRSITDNALYGFGNLRVRVAGMAADDPDIRMNGEMMRGWGLRFDGVDGFRTTSAITLGGVEMSREIKLSKPGNWARWLDSFTNTGDAPVDVDVSFGGTTGWNATSTSGSRTLANQSAVVDTTSGDTTIGADDAWAVVATPPPTPKHASAGDSDRGPSAVVFGTPTPFAGHLLGTGVQQRSVFDVPLPDTGTEANFIGYRHRLTLAPGETASLVHFVAAGRAETAATSGQQIAAVRGTAVALTTAPDLGGLGSGTVCTIRNIDLAALPGAPDCSGIPAPEAPAQRPAAAPVTTSPYDVVDKTIGDLQADMEAGRTTAQQITRAYLDRIAAYDRGPFGFHAFIHVAEDAMAQAKQADARRAAGEKGDLLGIPVAVKDLYDTKDMPTTTGTLALAGYQPKRDAFQVARLRAAGAVLIGKANLSEFANSGSQSESGWGQVWNAYKPSKTSLGSSGGSAVATATSMAAFGMGSQTGVSLYAPSTGASLVTMRGTDGISSLAGASPLTWMQDFLGPMARSVADVARILNVTTGTDPEDFVTVDGDADAKRPADWKAFLDPNALQGKRIGYLPAAYAASYGDDGTVEAVRGRFADLEALGATMVEMPDPPSTASPSIAVPSAGRREEGWRRYFERNADVAPFHTASEILSSPKNLPYNRQTVAPADRLTDEQIAALLASRKESKVRLAQWMDDHDVDVVVYPGFKSDVYDNDGATALSSDRGTGVPTSNFGVPTIVVPAGTNPHGDPISLQFVGRAWDDAKVLGYGYAFEQRVRGHVAPSTTPALAYDPSATPPPIENPKPIPPVTVAPQPDAPSNGGPAATATRPTPRVRLTTTSVRPDRKGRYALRLRCSTGAGSCRVRVEVRRGGRAVGNRTLTIRGGRTATARITATTAMRRALRRGGTLHLRVRLSGRRSTTIAGSRSVSVLLRPRR